MNIVRTDSTSQDFHELVSHLDRYLSGVNGDADDFFVQYNKIDQLKYVVVVYQDGLATACGAIKPYDDHTMEIKRMYVRQESRGQGIASAALAELEQWALELGYSRCILETADSMVDAVGLYQKAGYKRIEKYGQYADVETSVCFERVLLR